MLSRLWRWLVVISTGLFAVEVGPVTGLIVLMLFEFTTTVWVARAEAMRAVPGDGKRVRGERRRVVRIKAWDSAKQRFGVAVGLVAVVVYSNTSDLDWVKDVMFMTTGFLLLTLAWINLGKSNPFLRVVMRSLWRNLKARGIEFDEDDEEGAVAVIDAKIHAVVRPADGGDEELYGDPYGSPYDDGPPGGIEPSGYETTDSTSDR